MRIRPALLLASALLATMMVSAGVAGAEMPGVNPPATDASAVASVSDTATAGVEHHWVEQAMGVMPYTEPGGTEAQAVDVAKRSLTQLPPGVAKAADRGYASAQEIVTLGKALQKSSPAVVGHELIVWNGRRAVRVFVNQDGAITVMGAGTPWLLATKTVPVADHGDKDAASIARGAMALGRNFGASAADKAVVSAHAVGFANANGDHLVIRVTPDGRVSYPAW